METSQTGTVYKKGKNTVFVLKNKNYWYNEDGISIKEGTEKPHGFSDKLRQVRERST